MSFFAPEVARPTLTFRGLFGEVHYFGEVEATDAGMHRMIQRITANFAFLLRGGLDGCQHRSKSALKIGTKVRHFDRMHQGPRERP